MGFYVFLAFIIAGTCLYVRVVRRFAENAIQADRRHYTSADAGFTGGGDASYGSADGCGGFDGGCHGGGDGGGCAGHG